VGSNSTPKRKKARTPDGRAFSTGPKRESVPPWHDESKRSTALDVIGYLKGQVRGNQGPATVSVREIDLIVPNQPGFAHDTAASLMQMGYLIPVDARRDPGMFRIDPKILDLARDAVDSAGALTSLGDQNRLLLDDVQRDILSALDGKAMKVEALARAVAGGDTSRLYQRSGSKTPGRLDELKRTGLIAYSRKIGYFRPDAPPPEAIPPRVSKSRRKRKKVSKERH
jgi:hypothetical protein